MGMASNTFLRRYARDEQGSGTISGVFFLVTVALIGGIAIDTANAWRAQYQLQVAADAASLAAAAHIDDHDAARTIAKEVARRNLQGDTSAVTDADIYFGKWDTDQTKFVELDETAAPEDYDAVIVRTNRTASRANSVGTYVMRFAGVDSFNTGAYAIARSDIQTQTVETVGSGGSVDCSAATFITTANVNSGGSNNFYDGVCIYGRQSVAFGGSDYFEDTTRLISDDASKIRESHVVAGSAEVKDIKYEEHIETSILQNLDPMFAERWNAFYGKNGQNYAGDLVPDFIKNPATGTAKIVQYDGWWSIQPGQVQPYTIYVVNGGAQFSGNLDAQNVMFMVKGYFGTGGGWQLKFRDVFIFGTQVNLAGNVEWGDPTITCGENRYSAYLFAKTSLSMGGWAAPTPINGVVAVAPTISPGGAMTGRHLYFESSQDFIMGGDYDIWACDGATGGNLSSEWALTSAAGGPPVEVSEVKVRKARLTR